MFPRSHFWFSNLIDKYWLTNNSLAPEFREIYLAVYCKDIIRDIYDIYVYVYMYIYIYTLEKAMTTHSSTFAWKIPWAGEPGGLQSMGLQRVGHDWAIFTSLHSLHTLSLEKEMPIHSCILAWRIPWSEEPDGPWPMGSQRVGHNWSDWACIYTHICMHVC